MAHRNRGQIGGKTSRVSQREDVVKRGTECESLNGLVEKKKKTNPKEEGDETFEIVETRRTRDQIEELLNLIEAEASYYLILRTIVLWKWQKGRRTFVVEISLVGSGHRSGRIIIVSFISLKYYFVTFNCCDVLLPSENWDNGGVGGGNPAGCLYRGGGGDGDRSY